MCARRVRILAGVLLVVLFWGVPSLRAQDWSKERISQTQKSIVRLINLAADGSEVLRGNGFLISAEGLLLTNYHVIDRAEKLQIYTMGGDVYDRVVVKALDADADLALLKIPAFNAPFTAVAAPTLPSPGSPVIIVPRSKEGMEPTVVKGQVVAHHRLLSGAMTLSVNQRWDAFSRGAPVFNLAGECVGITSLGYRAEGGPGVFIDVNQLSSLLKQKIEALTESVSWDLFEPKSDGAVQGPLHALGLTRRFPVPSIRAEKDLARRLELTSAYDPTDIQTESLLAQTYLQRGRFQDATALIAEVLAREPSSTAVLTLKGDLAYHQGDFDAARGVYQEVVAKGSLAPHFYNSEFKGVELPDFYHDHALTGCTGPLILSSQNLTFLPSGWPNDQWTAPYAAVQRVQVKTSYQSGRPYYEFSFKFSSAVQNEMKTWLKDEFQLRTSAKATRDTLIAFMHKRGINVVVIEKK